MRNLAFAPTLLLTGMLSVACDRNAPTASGPVLAEQLAPVFSAAAGKMVPFKESYEATGTAGPAAECPILQVRLHGSGIATHLGRYTITNSHCLDPSTGVFTNGTLTKTIASGDGLFGVYEGRTLPDDILVGSLTFTGGTGRFEGAAGTATLRGTQTIDFSQPEPIHVVLSFEGTISSPGALK